MENHELWMKRKIKELQTEDPQEIADIIMEEVIRSCDGYINDDMTIVVAKVKKNMPKWATMQVWKWVYNCKCRRISVTYLVGFWSLC